MDHSVLDGDFRSGSLVGGIKDANSREAYLLIQKVVPDMEVYVSTCRGHYMLVLEPIPRRKRRGLVSMRNYYINAPTYLINFDS
jgi:hypothetical protein